MGVSQTILVESSGLGSWSQQASLQAPIKLRTAESLLHWFAKDRWRPPNWRWLLANEFADESLPVAEFEVLRSYLNSARNQRHAAFPADLADIHRAWSVWNGRGWPRMELESRILARQTDEEIAIEMSTSAETVRQYESVFFNVRSNLDVPAVIVSRALGGTDVRSEARPLYDAVKRTAFTGGKNVLHWALRAAAATPSELEQLNDTGQNLRQMRMWLLLEQVPINRTTASFLRRVGAELRDGASASAGDLLSKRLPPIEIPDTHLWRVLKAAHSSVRQPPMGSLSRSQAS